MYIEYTDQIQIHCLSNGETLTEVGEFEFAAVVYEKVLWFQVSMQHSSFVAIRQASQDLEEEQLGVEMINFGIVQHV